MIKRAAVSVLFIMMVVLPASAWAQPAPAPAPCPPGVSDGATPCSAVVAGETDTPADPAVLPPIPVAPPPPFETLSGLGDISASGAVQFLFQWRQEDANQPKVERFLTRRVQFSVCGRPTEKTRYGIVMDAVDGDLVNPAANGFEAQVREAWVGFDPLPWLAVDVGSFRPPWTLTMDDQVSDEIFVRYPLLVAANDFTPWRQTGGMVTGHGGRYFTVSAGVWNGLDNPDNFVDDNDKKDYMVSLKMEFYPGFRLFVGDWRGDTDVVSGLNVVDGEHNNIWLGGEVEKGGFTLGAEALWNRLNPDEGDNVNAFGYQVSLGYDWHSIQPVLRYEQFDPDNAVEDDEMEWTTLGVNFMITPSTRIMADYIFKAERQDNQTANDEFLVQVSTWF